MAGIGGGIAGLFVELIVPAGAGPRPVDGLDLIASFCLNASPPGVGRGLSGFSGGRLRFPPGDHDPLYPSSIRRHSLISFANMS
jgi:hypothetical protein